MYTRTYVRVRTNAHANKQGAPYHVIRGQMKFNFNFQSNDDSWTLRGEAWMIFTIFSSRTHAFIRLLCCLCENPKKSLPTVRVSRFHLRELPLTAWNPLAVAVSTCTTKAMYHGRCSLQEGLTHSSTLTHSSKSLHIEPWAISLKLLYCMLRG